MSKANAKPAHSSHINCRVERHEIVYRNFICNSLRRMLSSEYLKDIRLSFWHFSRYTHYFNNFICGG